jgi:4'-phosphopantetheinyl transferase
MENLTESISLTEVVRRVAGGEAVVIAQPVEAGTLSLDRLSDEEKARAAAFSHSASRQAFLTGRTLLRTVLEAFVKDVRISLGPHGKPDCRDPNVPQFNLSHSGGRVAVVFSFSGPVGVDLESRHRVPRNPDRIAAKVFSSPEREVLKDRPGEFLTLWTRKEALLKAMGQGFAVGASSLDPEQILQRSGWRLDEFICGDLLGAVCVPASTPTVFRKGLC